MKATLTVGCSASGKTTFAKTLVEQGWLDVNRDEIRFNKYCNGVHDWSLYKFTKEKENSVTLEQERMVDYASVIGQNVVISDTNLNDKTRNFWIKRLSDLGYTIDLKYFDVDLMELLERDAKRSNGVGYKVITKQYETFMKLIHSNNYHKHIAGLKHCIIADIDGTVAQMVNRTPFEWDKVGTDLPRKHVVDIVKNYHYDTHNEIIFVSGRDSSCAKQTRDWLIDNVGLFTEQSLLLMRPEGDMRKDTVVKREIFNKYIRNKYNVDYVLDDRPSVVRMWKYELGMEVICVANPFIEF